MILVTGGAGKTGLAVISQLAEVGAEVRALVRREGQEELVREVGAREVVVGDMGDSAVVAGAMVGVRAVYQIAPNMHPAEVEMGRLALDAARDAGVQRFVYHSVLHPQTEAMPHHWRKLRVEEMVLESGVPFTILQPAAYMQNLRGSWQAIVEEGRYRVPYPVSSRLSLVHLDDVAEVAAMVLGDPGHEGATYELVGSLPLSQTEVAQELSRVLQQPVQAEQVDLEEWRRNAESTGLGSQAIEDLLRMFRYYAANGFVGNSNVLRWLLNRPPRSLQEAIRELATG
jgi:uncharacterized protein YbjT (DUF2867 family)